MCVCVSVCECVCVYVCVKQQWIGVNPWVQGMSTSVLAFALQAGGIAFARAYLLNVNWRLTLAWTTVIVAVIMYLPCIFIDLDYLRNQFFWAGVPLFMQLAYGVAFIVSTYCAVEVADAGSEGIMYGFLTTVANIAMPLGSLISANLTELFKLYENGKLVNTPVRISRPFPTLRCDRDITADVPTLHLVCPDSF
jgi:hypothetical protein